MKKQRVLVEQRVYIEETPIQHDAILWHVLRAVAILLVMALAGAAILAVGLIALLVGAIVGTGWLVWKIYTTSKTARERKAEEQQKAKKLAELDKRAELLRLSNESRKLDYLEWLRSGAQQPTKLLEVVQPSSTRRIDYQSKAKK